MARNSAVIREAFVEMKAPWTDNDIAGVGPSLPPYSRYTRGRFGSSVSGETGVKVGELISTWIPQAAVHILFPWFVE